MDRPSGFGGSASKGRQVAMESVRVIMLGCGGFARYRLGNLLEVPEAEVVALVDPDAAQVDQTRRRHAKVDGAHAFSTYEEALAAVEADAVMIATPHSQHTDQILQSFRHGLHVCCEKPLTTSVPDAWRVIEARDRAGLIGMVSYQRHFQPEFRAIRKRIASGEAGRVRYVSALLTQQWKRFTTGSWRQDPSLSGGGMLLDSGSHMVDVLLWMGDLIPQAVAACIDDRDAPVEIDSSVTVRFEGGVIGNLAIVGDAHRWHEDMTVICERQSFYIRDGSLTIVEENGDSYAAKLGGGSSPDRHFIDVVLGRTENESPFECGLRVVELTEGAYESARRGGAPVEVASLRK